MFSWKSLRRPVRRIIRKIVNRRILAFAVVFGVLMALLFSNYIGPNIDLKPGQISSIDIYSPRTAVITDEKETKRLQHEAAQKVRKVYREDSTAMQEAERRITLFYGNIGQIRADKQKNTRVKQIQISDYLQARLREKNISGFRTDDLARYLTEVTPRDIDTMMQGSVAIVQTLMSQSITEEDVPKVIRQIPPQAQGLGLSPVGEKVVEVAVADAIGPNLIFDAEATMQALEEAERSVIPPTRTIRLGQKLVSKGEPVTADQIDVLKQLGVQRSNSFWVNWTGAALVVLIFLGIVALYIRSYHPDVFDDERLMMLLGLVFVLLVGLAKILIVIKIGDRPEINALTGYLIPVSACAMLIAILVNEDLGYVLSFVGALFVGLLAQANSMAFAITAFVGGAVGVFWVTRLNTTSDMAKSALYVAGANVVVIFSMFLLQGNTSSDILLYSVAFGILNGFLSAVLTIGLIPYLESLFSITSMFKLLELANPNQRVLRRLLMEAPGTYHHSIMVGNLAEAAAECVGANSLLVRVGAYYHDIGKLKRAYFFVENQLGQDNPHEKIAPSLSSLIITCHIKDGVELANENRLPRIIIDFIEQHHGTSLIKYFYNRALEEDKQGAVSEETFRYEGPKPQSKEAALVMLADSVEAAVRSLKDPSPGIVEGTVRKIIKDKLYDGQLEESALTFRDLNVIAERFSKVLTGVYHTRIEYPETLAREFEKRRDSLENIDRKPADNQ